MGDDVGDRLIVFTLWGQHPRYNRGAVENTQLARHFYPGWECRFYVASDAPALATLRKKPYVEVVEMAPPLGEGWYALFWRLLPCSEPGVERLIFRECDSRLSDREAQAVKAWEQSDRPLHAIRDIAYHDWPAIPSGLWGMKTGAVPDLHERLWSWMRFNWNPSWGKHHVSDERFLAERIWSPLKEKFLVHGFGGLPFPPHTPLEFGQFCGQQLDENDEPLKQEPEEVLYRG